MRLAYARRMSARKTDPKPNTDTPAMRQYKRFKQEHPGCVLFFRMGDFYEMFFEDAELAHRVLGIAISERTAGIPMSGVPHHSVENYLRRMIQAGHRVAVCEQVEDAAQAKGVVKRDVTRVVTPGTLTDAALLEDGDRAVLAAVCFLEAGGEIGKKGGGEGLAALEGLGRVALSWAELSTGALQVAELSAVEAADELARLGAAEVLYCATADGAVPPRVTALMQAAGVSAPLSGRPGWQFRQSEAVDVLKKQFAVVDLKGYGFDDDEPALSAAGAVIAYLLETQRSESGRLAHLRPPQRFDRGAHLVIDPTSLASLEVEHTLRGTHGGGGDSDTLLAVLGRGGGRGGGGICTAVGRRKLRDWLCYPLSDRGEIEARQRVVRAMVDDERFRRELGGALGHVQDIPRMVARLACGRASPRDVVGLGVSAAAAADLRAVLDQRPPLAGFLGRLDALADALGELASCIADACVEEPPGHLREGGLFRDGHDAALDEQRVLQKDSNTWLVGYQAELVERSGIESLKVGYNKVFGYYIEVSAAKRDLVDDRWNWIRKQTLKNAERFITPELKDYEGKVLAAKDRGVAREQELFDGLCGDASAKMDQLHAFSEIVAELDVLRCFAERAVRWRYVQPAMIDEPVLDLAAARHPVLDELLGDRFVPNDLALSASGERAPGTNTGAGGGDAAHSLALITGPNMAGKSTFIRQAALLVLMAHTGSFIPADAATIGLCDRIFTRVGAHDELHAGRSTFMVEMTETANICHHATPRSLVILDEIGRGTSTLDGLSLAWAITEHLHAVGARALFATHYHELTRLAADGDASTALPGVRNLQVLVREWDDRIVFLHRIETGSADRSYGVQVARLAGLPDAVVDRAKNVLESLAVSRADAVAVEVGAAPAAGAPAARGAAVKPQMKPQMSLFTEYVSHPVVERVAEVDLDTLTPMAAFELLRELKASASASGAGAGA